MKNKLIVLTLVNILLLINNPTSAQKLDSLKNWRIHKLVDSKALMLKEDSLEFIPSRLLSRSFLEEVSQLNTLKTDSTVIIMSAYLLSYEDANGKMKKVLACGAGNFLYIGQHKKFYGIHPENREAWLEILSDEYGKLHED